MKLLQDEMSRMFWFIIPLFLFVVSVPAFSQADEEPPVTPLFNMVTVNQLTGNTELSWSLSPSPDVAGYVVYLYQNGEGYAIDTIYNPAATSFTLYRPGSSYFSESFVIAAIDNSGNISPLSNELHTIFTETQIDTCNKKLIVKWNKYASLPVKVTGYAVFGSVNGSNFTMTGQVSEDKSNFVIDDFIIDTEYCFIVKAILENGQVSVSNKSCLIAKMQRPPIWINADYATITPPDAISLSFTIDPSSEINLFKLERRSGASGVFQQIAQLLTYVESVTYTDKEADLNIVNNYRLSAINNCNVPVVSSNLCSNMVLTAQGTGNDIRLIWNQYRNWNGSVASYRLFIDTGNGFNEKAVIQPSDTVFIVSIPEVMYDLTSGKVCFYISASEASNPFGITGESRSNETCFVIEEKITVPNVFTPDGDLINDLFRPVLTFTPSEYYLVITDRQGRILFETRDFTESWDGLQNGNPYPQGVCLWFLKVRTPLGRSISKTGTLTIYKSR